MSATSDRVARRTPKPRDYFATTQWTMVLNAGNKDSASAREALEQLCRTYWYPLYAHARRRGLSPEDAEDSTQGFFARLLELNSLTDVRREKGKFRSFLLVSLNHYLSDRWDRARAQKRGSGQVIPLDRNAAEGKLSREPADTRTPESAFEQKWAMTVLETVVERLRREYEAGGKGELFLALRFCIAGDKSEEPYAKLAARLNLGEPALRVAVHRLRQRYQRLLRDEIGRTVTTAAEIEGELRHLFAALAS